MGPPRHNANQISKENKEDREDEEGKKEEIKKTALLSNLYFVKLVSIYVYVYAGHSCQCHKCNALRNIVQFISHSFNNPELFSSDKCYYTAYVPQISFFNPSLIVTDICNFGCLLFFIEASFYSNSFRYIEPHRSRKIKHYLGNLFLAKY